ncbi:hypothetical protein CVD28_06015 [Bacillus sp. M6-12]|uniref:putative bifunctional diguanylate cyclase/phosphodiesterase n=1 Tax=Bacillus sp. M6-12 TaxID=2054166 RepID=UPI000C766545|nr:EAL domain-containing protein [Bacillus sp. M6-12]PLS18680.1 hypothetical protein CVD28_06015 [Bacillus sp. M6-12]
MKFRNELYILVVLLTGFISFSYMLYAKSLIEADDIFSVGLEGITFLSILFFLMLTIKMKAQKLLVLGCLFVSIGSVLNILDVIEGIELPGFIDVYIENGLFSIGIAMCSIGVFILLNKENEMKRKLKHQATHDSLTNLPNWYMINDYLAGALARCQKSNKELAVMFLDLDRFKFVNDTKGHKAGDLVLKKVAERLAASVRDGHVVARKSGDEFIIVLEDADKASVIATAKRVLKSFKEPFFDTNEEVFISTSIGISLFPQDGNTPDTLIHKADKAMYMAKKQGKNNFQFVKTESDKALTRKVQLESALRKAIQNDELMLHYQPQLELKTGKLKGVEALLRWNHPVFGSISPMEFIPIAEETGIIVQIGEWVIDEACRQNRIWQDEGFTPIRIAVNVSALQFQNSRLIKNIRQTLENYELDPELLELEITESVMHDLEDTFHIFADLKEIGVKISIDDFGTGYSSLSVLHKLTMDYVKIDKSFVQEIWTSPTSATLVKTIIDIGSTMNFKLIAEGIEDEDQAKFLEDNGCHLGQGYYYSRPLPTEEIEVFMKEQMKENSKQISDVAG